MLPRWRKLALAISAIVTIALVAFGILHVLLVFLGRTAFAPYISQPYTRTNETPSQKFWDIMKDVDPIPCHSHNDYLKKLPLFEALQSGCISVEADIFVQGEELRIGHDMSSIHSGQSLENLYLDNLTLILDTLNRNSTNSSAASGVFAKKPEQSLVLLLDFKSDKEIAAGSFQRHLDPLRDRKYLSRWDGKRFVQGPLTIVASGKIPFATLTSLNSHHDIFFDAPLNRLNGADGNAWNTSNAYYASISLSEAVGSLQHGRLSSGQIQTIRSHVKSAHMLGLKARFWATPSWPTSVRNYVWQALIKEGVDILNMDDLEAASYQDWTKVAHIWFDG